MGVLRESKVSPVPGVLRFLGREMTEDPKNVWQLRSADECL